MAQTIIFGATLADGDDIAEGQIDEFSRWALVFERLIFDVPRVRRVPLGDPAFEHLPGHRMRTRARHRRLEPRAFGLADNFSIVIGLALWFITIEVSRGSRPSRRRVCQSPRSNSEAEQA
jgi:hypothetical protein